MFYLYLKRQMHLGILCGCILCVILSIWQYSRIADGLPYRAERKQFIQDYAEDWQETAKTAYLESIEKEGELESFQNYPAELERDNAKVRVDRAALLWLDQMMADNGVYTDNLNNDVIFLNGLVSMAEREATMADTVENRLLLYSRNIKRCQEDVYLCKLYTKMLEHTQKIETAHVTCSTLEAEAFFSYWKSDFIFLLLVFLTSFAGMTEFVHSSNGRQVIIAPVSAREYILKQYIWNLVFVMLLYLAYMGTTFLLWKKAAFPSAVLGLPVQIIDGCQEVVFPLSAGQYLIFLSVVDLVVCLTVSAIIQFISFCAANVTISFSVSALFLILVLYNGYLELPQVLAEGLPYVPVFDEPIEKYWILLGGCAGTLILCGVLMGLSVTLRMKNCCQKGER